MKRARDPANEQDGADEKRLKMKHWDFVRMNKTTLENIFCYKDFHDQIRTKVFETKKPLIEHSEYNTMRSKSAGDLLDLLLNKGEETCEMFLSLLREDEDLKTTIPRLKDLAWDQLDQPEPESQTGPSSTCPTTPGPSRSGLSRSGPSRSGLSRSGPSEVRTRTILQGYIHSVSGLKKKTKTFFMAQLFDGQKNVSIICFKLEDQQLFQDAQKLRSPVRLDGVFVEKQHCYNSCSSLHVLDSLPFTLDPSHAPKNLTLAEIQADKENSGNNKVNVQVKMFKKVEVGYRLTKSDHCKHLEKWQVGDMTGSAHLTVWEPLSAEEDSWYCFTNVRVGQFNCDLTLQTTPDTTMSPVRCTHKAVCPDSAPYWVEGAIEGYQLEQASLVCPRNHLMGEEHCEQCDMTYVSSSVRRVLKGRLAVRGKEQDYDLEDCHIRQLLEDHQVDTLSIHKMKQQLKEVQQVALQVFDQRLVSVKVLKAELLRI